METTEDQAQIAWLNTITDVRSAAPDYWAALEGSIFFAAMREMFLIGFVQGQFAAFKEVNQIQLHARNQS